MGIVEIIMLIITIIMMIIMLVTMKHPKPPSQSQQSMKMPTIKVGTPLAKVYGRVIIKNPVIFTWGDLLTIKEKTDTGAKK